MALFGGSKSSSLTSILNEDKRVIADNGGIGVSGTANVNMLDGGAIKSAFDFGNTSLKTAFDFGNTSADKSFDFARDFSKDSNALSEMIVDKAFKTTSDNSRSAFNAALQAVQPQPIDIKLVAVAAAAVVAVFYFASK